jgi:hypothetical protein
MTESKEAAQPYGPPAPEVWILTDVYDSYLGAFDTYQEALAELRRYTHGRGILGYDYFILPDGWG